MGVILNIYVLPPERAAHEPVQDVARALSRAGIVKPPFLAGSALRDEPASLAGRARSPDTATAVHARYPEVYQRFDVLDQALAALDRPDGGMVEVGVEAHHFRIDPGHFAWSASLGFYRLPQGYALRIGADEDMSEFVEDWRPEPPTFEGRVTEWIWLQGKAAPPLEDFRGSPLHKAVLAAWPDARFFDESWL